VSIYGDDLDSLAAKAREIEQVVHTVDGAVDVRAQQQAGKPQVLVRPDRRELSRLGIGVNDFLETVETGIGGSTAGQVFDRLQRSPRPVLLDCPAGAGPDAAVPLRAADRSVVVSTPEPQSLRDATKTAAMARQLDAPPAAVVLVRSDATVDPTPLVGCQRVVHVPELPKPPLETEESASRHLHCAKTLSKRNV